LREIGDEQTDVEFDRIRAIGWRRKRGRKSSRVTAREYQEKRATNEYMTPLTSPHNAIDLSRHR
jgi:hypothetical protein